MLPIISSSIHYVSFGDSCWSGRLFAPNALLKLVHRWPRWCWNQNVIIRKIHSSGKSLLTRVSFLPPIASWTSQSYVGNILHFRVVKNPTLSQKNPLRLGHLAINAPFWDATSRCLQRNFEFLNLKACHAEKRTLEGQENGSLYRSKETLNKTPLCFHKKLLSIHNCTDSLIVHDCSPWCLWIISILKIDVSS